jgi:sterol desaturase/sphingolipid hydroxylase (fatty acid hydroxylase superfamily)
MEAGQPVRRASRAFVIFTIAMMAVMVFPLFAIGNRIEPMVLGLPFSMAWVVGWILVEFVVLVGFYRYEHGGGDS